MANRETSSQIAQECPSGTDEDPWMWVATAAYRVARASSYGPCPDADLRQLQVAVRAARGVGDPAPRQLMPGLTGTVTQKNGAVIPVARGYGHAMTDQPARGYGRTLTTQPGAEPRGIGPRTSAYYRGDQLPSINGKQLTVREYQILNCAAQGKSNEHIGRELFVSEHTIKTHLRRLFDKIGAANRAHAVAIAFRQGALS